MILFLLIGLLLGALSVIFALQNITTITVVFLGWQLQGSLALILIIAVLAGVIMSAMFSLPQALKRSFQISSLRKQNIKLMEEMERQKSELHAEKMKSTTLASIPNLTTTKTTSNSSSSEIPRHM